MCDVHTLYVAHCKHYSEHVRHTVRRTTAYIYAYVYDSVKTALTELAIRLTCGRMIA